MDADALTIGFVGRFVAYKRPTLFLRDPDRLARILGDPDRPVQIIFGGKAHPRDEFGKELLRQVIEFRHQRHLEHRVVFIEDFDITMDRALSRGVDLWLNTPRRPLEACGIGGMKAGVNGALNLSTLDGWWDEVWHDADPALAPIGWCIGTGRHYEDFKAQDASDAESLYEALEHQIIPKFYDRDAQGLPRAWLASVRESMSSLAPTWHSHRMVRDYVESFYLPSANRGRWLAAHGYARARELSAALERLLAAWPAIRVTVSATVAPGGAVHAEIVADLGSLKPQDVSVQLWVAPTRSDAVPDSRPARRTPRPCRPLWRSGSPRGRYRCGPRCPRAAVPSVAHRSVCPRSHNLVGLRLVTTNPHIPAALRNLAVDSGIVLEYVDATGVRRCADPEAVLAVLNALGTPIGQVSEAARMLRSRRSARLERIVEPVTVVDDASVGKILVSLREADIDLECAIESEEGERVEWRIRRDDLVSLSV